MIDLITDRPKRIPALTLRLLILVLTLVQSLSASAQMLHVDPNAGLNVNTCGSASAPCQTIQYAIDNLASDGDTIYLFAGVYSLSSSVSTDSAVVEFLPDMGLHFIGDSTGTNAVIDGNAERRGFHYDHSGNCPSSNGPHNATADTRRISLHNITIQNCQYPGEMCGSTTQSRGAGVHILADPLDSLIVQITNCAFQSNLVHDSLGANNHGRSATGGAIYLNGRHGSSPSSAEYTDLYIDSCKFTNNGAVQLPNGGWGGAIGVIALSDMHITNSSFCSNYVVGIDADAGDLQHDRNAGGAILINDQNNTNPATQYEIDQCAFISNTATTPNGSSFNFQSGAGGVFMTRGDNLSAVINAVLKVSNSDFYGNYNELGLNHIGNNSGTIDTVSIGNNQFKESAGFYLGPDTSFCGNDSIILNASTAAATYLWMDGSTDSVLVVTSATTDTIWVEIDLFGCVISDTVVITNESLSPSLLGADTALCRFDGLELDPGISGLELTWQDGTIAQTYQVDSAGTYWFVASDTSGCTVSDTIQLSKAAPLVEGLEEDTTICQGSRMTLEPGFTNVSYEWLDGSTTNTLVVDSAGAYWFTAMDSLGCIITDTQNISISQVEVDLGPDTTFCLNATNTFVLAPGSGQGSYLWSTGAQSSSLAVEKEGFYWVRFTNTIGCASSDSINVDIGKSPEVFFNAVPSLCEGDELTLDPVVIGATELTWFNDAKTDSIVVTESGIYTLTASNACGETEAELTVSMDVCECKLFVPNVLTPNHDGINDGFEPQITCDLLSYEVVIYNRWGGKMFHSTQLNGGWDGYVNGELYSEGTYYYVIRYQGPEDESEKRLTGSFSLIH